MRAAFDGDGLVDDVAFNPRGRGQADFQAADAADHPAVDHDVIGDDLAASRFAVTLGYAPAEKNHADAGNCCDAQLC